jgi:alkanesulfonate monooxygenase SsuD/methylene tetrahydromethanopterin reductase-like flavin-dependent oxidoreductase (luciferase family)
VTSSGVLSEYGRTIGTMTYGLVVARDTERGARRQYDYIIEKEIGRRLATSCAGRRERVFSIHRSSNLPSASSPVGRLSSRRIPGADRGPDARAQRIGIEGIILSWLDYNEEIEYFGRRVLPLMEQAGLRSRPSAPPRIGG